VGRLFKYTIILYHGDDTELEVRMPKFIAHLFTIATVLAGGYIVLAGLILTFSPWMNLPNKPPGLGFPGDTILGLVIVCFGAGLIKAGLELRSGIESMIKGFFRGTAIPIEIPIRVFLFILELFFRGDSTPPDKCD
jgi:hypothetical protein